jgi:hypothetical protein
VTVWESDFFMVTVWVDLREGKSTSYNTGREGRSNQRLLYQGGEKALVTIMVVLS